MKISTMRLLAAALMLSSVSTAPAQDRAYTEGPVVRVIYIRTEPGKFDEFMKYASTTYKALMEEEKKAGIILDYGFYRATPRTLEEPDVILTITYKDWAALDGLDEKTAPIYKKMWSSLEKANQASTERGKLRTQLGTEFLRKLVLE